MSENNDIPLELVDEVDEIELLVKREHITAECTHVDTRPDVSLEEQQAWIKQDPDYPPEHYRCLLKYRSKELELYQTVGADYPDEDDESGSTDLYRDSRALLLSAEFLAETAALKANSIEEVKNLKEWMANRYCETMTPEETYLTYRKIRDGLIDLLGVELYRTLLQLAVEAEQEEESED